MDPKDFYNYHICCETILPPILQCTEGHVVCSTCYKQIDHCPQCRTPYTIQLRNLGMEKLAANVQFACKNFSHGCQQMMAYSSKPEHENVCAFQKYLCLSVTTQVKCIWEGGSPEEAGIHVREHHKNIALLMGEDVVFVAEDVDREEPVFWVMIQHCFEHDFMLVLSKQKRIENEAARFFCFV